MSFFGLNLVILSREIDLREELGSREVVKQIIDERQRVIILTVISLTLNSWLQVVDSCFSWL